MATAVVSLPPRPRVVTSPNLLIPWKPAMSTMRRLSNSRRMRSVEMDLMRAPPWALLVCSSICQPVRLTAGRCSFSSCIAMSATEICSPTVSSTSSSRLEGAGLISLAFSMRSSVVSPWAESTTTTSFPAR